MAQVIVIGPGGARTNDNKEKPDTRRLTSIL
jgi:hypothetical protein